MKTRIILICITALLLSGCSFAIYGRFGPQKVEDFSLIVGKQESDPNMADLVTIGAAVINQAVK